MRFASPEVVGGVACAGAATATKRRATMAARRRPLSLTLSPLRGARGPDPDLLLPLPLAGEGREEGKPPEPTRPIIAPAPRSSGGPRRGSVRGPSPSSRPA